MSIIKVQFTLPLFACHITKDLKLKYEILII